MRLLTAWYYGYERIRGVLPSVKLKLGVVGHSWGFFRRKYRTVRETTDMPREGNTNERDGMNCGQGYAPLTSHRWT